MPPLMLNRALWNTSTPFHQGDVEKKHMIKCIRRIMDESGLAPPSDSEMATLAFGNPDADDDEGEGEDGGDATGILALYAKVKAGLCTGFGRSFVVKMDELPLTVGQLAPNRDYRVEVAVANAFGSSPFGKAAESELAAYKRQPPSTPVYKNSFRSKQTSPKVVHEVQSPDVHEGEGGGHDQDRPDGEAATAVELSTTELEAGGGASGEGVTFESPRDGAGGEAATVMVLSTTEKEAGGGASGEGVTFESPRDGAGGEARAINRSSSRTFSASGEVVEAEVRALFDLLDRNKDGNITRIEVIRTIRDAGKTNDSALLQQLEDTLGLPDAIKQEHGRDQFEKVFQELDGMHLTK